MIMQLLHYYYDEEILTQDVIFKWYNKESLYEGGSDIRKRVGTGINYYNSHILKNTNHKFALQFSFIIRFYSGAKIN